VWVTHPPVRPLQLAPVPAAPDKIHSVSDLKKVERYWMNSKEFWRSMVSRDTEEMINNAAMDMYIEYNAFANQYKDHQA
jgi:hypothetical protein